MGEPAESDADGFGLVVESRRVSALRDRLECQVLETVPRVRVNGAGSTRVPNTSSLGFQGIDGESIVLGRVLREEDVDVTVAAFAETVQQLRRISSVREPLSAGVRLRRCGPS